jgi:hypothetical protein
MAETAADVPGLTEPGPTEDVSEAATAVGSAESAGATAAGATAAGTSEAATAEAAIGATPLGAASMAGAAAIGGAAWARAADERPAEEDTTDEGPAEVVFRLPTAEEVLRSRGLEGELLAAALAALAAQHGDPARLTAGEYRVRLRDPQAGMAPAETAAATESETVADMGTAMETQAAEGPAAEPAAAAAQTEAAGFGPCTNQQVISALYRAGEGSWALFERTGLVLSELAAHRNEPYVGPDLDRLGDLSADERAAVRDELDRLTRDAART